MLPLFRFFSSDTNGTTKHRKGSDVRGDFGDGTEVLRDGAVGAKLPTRWDEKRLRDEPISFNFLLNSSGAFIRTSLHQFQSLLSVFFFASPDNSWVEVGSLDGCPTTAPLHRGLDTNGCAGPSNFGTKGEWICRVVRREEGRKQKRKQSSREGGTVEPPTIQ